MLFTHKPSHNVVEVNFTPETGVAVGTSRRSLKSFPPFGDYQSGLTERCFGDPCCLKAAVSAECYGETHDAALLLSHNRTGHPDATDSAFLTLTNI